MKRGHTMKKITLIFIILLTAAALFAQNRTQPATVNVSFHNFAWGTSMDAFKSKMGNPVHIEEVNGLQSLIYDNISMTGYSVYMIAYFSQSGLEGGAYYFLTTSVEELMKCYTDVQNELLAQYGPTLLKEVLLREMRPYETSWDLSSGYIHLRVNTRQWSEPVTLWYSSPELTRRLRG